MQYGERAFFDNDHCAHCAAYAERNRLAGIDRRARMGFARARRAYRDR